MTKRKRVNVSISPPPLLFSPPQSLVQARANLVLEEPDIAIEDPSELAVQSDAEAITQDTDDQHVITDDEEHISKQRPSSGIVLTFQKAIIDGHFPQFSGDISSPLGQEETGQTQGVYRSIITFLEAFDMKVKAFADQMSTAEISQLLIAALNAGTTLTTSTQIDQLISTAQGRRGTKEHVANLRTLLVQNFTSPSYATELEDAIHGIRQRQDESLQSFLQRFELLMDRATTFTDEPTTAYRLKKTQMADSDLERRHYHCLRRALNTNCRRMLEEVEIVARATMQASSCIGLMSSTVLAYNYVVRLLRCRDSTTTHVQGFPPPPPVPVLQLGQQSSQVQPYRDRVPNHFRGQRGRGRGRSWDHGSVRRVSTSAPPTTAPVMRSQPNPCYFCQAQGHQFFECPRVHEIPDVWQRATPHGLRVFTHTHNHIDARRRERGLSPVRWPVHSRVRLVGYHSQRHPDSMDQPARAGNGIWVHASIAGSEKKGSIDDQFLLDTGAELSCISLSVVIEILQGNSCTDIPPQVRQDTGITAISASGDRMDVVGTVTLNVTTLLQQRNGDKRIASMVPTLFLVFEDAKLNSPLLLGMNWLKQANMTVEFNHAGSPILSATSSNSSGAVSSDTPTTVSPKIPTWLVETSKPVELWSSQSCTSANTDRTFDFAAAPIQDTETELMSAVLDAIVFKEEDKPIKSLTTKEFRELLIKQPRLLQAADDENTQQFLALLSEFQDTFAARIILSPSRRRVDS